MFFLFLFLLWDFGCQTAEFVPCLIDLALDFGALQGIEGDRGSDQASVRPAGDRHHHLEITQQLGKQGRGRIGWALPLHFQKQLGIFENPLPNRSRSVSPSGIQLPGFATGETVRRERFGQALAILGAGTRHRHQELHRYVDRDRATAYLLLHPFGEQFHKRQSARHPTHAAIKTARQLLQAVVEALLEFRQQPTFFQSAVAFRPTQRAIQYQRFRFAQGPDHGFDRVSAELFQSGDALVTVNDQIAVGLVGHRDNDDRCLLSPACQRRQQFLLPLRIPHSQKFIAAVQLMKLELHPCSPSARAILRIKLPAIHSVVPVKKGWTPKEKR